jgi:hypothetical protein
MEIEIGNQSGPYFNQRATDEVMKPLAELIKDSIPAAEQFKLWYDNVEDFHHLSFRANGKLVDIKVYKGMSYTVDGKDGWVGCPTYQRYSFVESIAKAVR